MELKVAANLHNVTALRRPRTRKLMIDEPPSQANHAHELSDNNNYNTQLLAQRIASLESVVRDTGGDLANYKVFDSKMHHESEVALTEGQPR